MPLAPNRFDYSPLIDRPIIKWPNNARVALWVAPNLEHYEYTPHTRLDRPDVPTYSRQDYGNRVGFWRMAEVLDKHKVRATVSLNIAVLDHFPEVREAMVARNWDYMAHGIYNTRPITDLPIDQEREFWRDAIATVKKYTGKQIKGMFAGGGGYTPNTDDLMAEAGCLYNSSWMADDQPFPLKVTGDRRFVCVPYSYQINDVLTNSRSNDAAYMNRMIKDHFDVIYGEAAENSKVMCIALHPYWIGRPEKAKYLDEALQYILGHEGVWNTTADDIAEYYLANYYDKAVASLAERKQAGLA